MKKKLEAELISIAHRILKLKNKSELVQLHQETQKLYEKLSVLRFVEDNFGEAKPTIGYKEVEEKLEATFEEKEEVVVEETPSNEEVEETPVAETPEENVSEAEEEVTEENEVEEETTDEAKEEELTEEKEAEETVEVAEEETPEEEVSDVEKEAVAESEDEEEPVAVEKEEEPSVEEEEGETPAESKSEEKKEDLFVPTFELAFDKKDEVEEVAKESGHQIIFEDFLGSDYKELEFIKAEIEKKHEEEPEPVKAEVVAEIEEFKEVQEAPEKEEVEEPVKREFPEAPQYDGIKITKGITFGLNDKVGFVSQLFAGSNEDFNRVISQLNTFNTFQDAKNFIEDLVKPDYNEWKGKEDFEERFLEVVENKFK